MALLKEAAAAADNTVIGPSILISGRLTGDEDLTVRGRVEGELSLSRTLIVETSGVVKANVTVRNAIVSGVVVGNITASESVELTRDGRMVGDIRAPRVIIVDGASFRGRVDMGNAEPGRTAAERPLARPVARPAVPGRTLPALPAARTAVPTARTVPVAPVRTAATPPPAARPLGKPLPPPPPAPARQEAPEARAAAPVPPAPPAMAAGAKKKVIVKKATKAR